MSQNEKKKKMAWIPDFAEIRHVCSFYGLNPYFYFDFGWDVSEIEFGHI